LVRRKEGHKNCLMGNHSSLSGNMVGLKFGKHE